MKINLEKLQEVEAKYRNDSITLNALQTMVDAVLSQRDDGDPFGLKLGPNVAIATSTLTELGIINWEGVVKPKKSEKLNS